MEDNPSAANDSQSEKNPRYVRKISFLLRVLSATETALAVGKTVEMETYDISAGGLRYQSDLSLPLGTEVELTLRLSSSFEPTVVAQVLRFDVVEDEMGKSHQLVALKFSGVAPEVRTRIREFLTPKFSFQKETGEAKAVAPVKDPSKEPPKEKWSSVGVTELDPISGDRKSEEES
jgi:hypothetical protein